MNDEGGLFSDFSGGALPTDYLWYKTSTSLSRKTAFSSSLTVVCMIYIPIH